MREKLVRDIKRKFGPVYGSDQLKALCQEIITNALDRYDEELQNGSSDIKAYRVAYDSIGDIKELKESLGIHDKRNFRATFIIIAVSVLLLTVSVVVSAYSGVWLLFIGTLIAVALTGVGIWRLVTGNRHSLVPHIVSVAIGVHILLYVGMFTFIIGLQLIEDARAETYDYTSRYAQVRSVELVEINKVVIHGDGTKDVFDYTVIKELDSSKWEECLKDCAKLKYSRTGFGDPVFLTQQKDCEFILIHFEENDDPCFCAFYSSLNPGYLEGSEGFFMVQYKVRACDYDGWEAILKKYFDYTL